MSFITDSKEIFMTRKWLHWFFPLALAGLFLLLVRLSLPAGCVYGSNTDWLSQHTALAETIRTAMLEQKSLMPSFLPLGGGSNGFQFSYYGYLRPDILIGCLLPAVPMYRIVIAYSLGGWLAAVLLFYLWLRRQRLSCFDAFIGSVLFLTASCFFHTHRQLMFVNYMPFLMLALLSVQRHPRRVPPLLPLWLLLICLHSFYYAPACFVVVGWYWAWLSGRYFFRPWFTSCALGGFLAFSLLLPTGLSILEHRRASASGDAGFSTFFEDFQSLLYSSYGLGVTLVVLYLLLLGIGIRQYRKTSLIFLLLFLWGGISYLLNATLYARAKILIPFLPLLILHSAKILADLRAGRTAWKLWPFPLLLTVIFRYRHRSAWTLILADFAFLLAAVLLAQVTTAEQRDSSEGVPAIAGTALRRILSRAAFLCLLIMPCVFFLRSASKEDFVTKEQMADASRTPDFSLQQEPLYRYDTILHPLAKGNRDVSASREKTSMYSSVYNHVYSELYYDILKTPIQINNRLAILTADNPFLLHFMGIRYLESSPSQIPDGYRVLWQEDGLAVSENDSVLPTVYLTSDTMTETLFSSLRNWEQAEALTRCTVIPDDLADSGTLTAAAGQSSDRETDEETSALWSSGIRYYRPMWASKRIPATVQIEASGSDVLNRNYELTVTRDSTVTLEFQQPLENQVLLLQFQVENQTKKAVVITVNGVKNKLSDANAGYPNGNDCFQYQFLNTSDDGLTTLKIRLSKGHYTLKNIRFGLLDAEVFSEKSWSAVDVLDKTPGEILACSANAETDTWFVTSIPMQNGLYALIDGQKSELTTVNTAFAGLKLSAGQHEIRLCFDPPGKAIGILISGLACLAWLALVCLQKYQLYKMKHRHD